MAVTFNSSWPTGLVPFEQTGGAMPWANSLLNNNAFHDAANNLTWITWERGFTAGDKRVVMAATRNTANTWSTTDYLVGTNTLKDDAHGPPAIVVDSAGYCYCFYGAHNSSILVDSTANANDPSVWFDRTTIAGTHTFPQPVKVGSSFYLFSSIPSVANPTQLQGAIEVRVFTPSAGTLTQTGIKTLADGYDGVNPSWFVNTDVAVNGTDIHFTAIWAVNDGFTKQASYYLIYDTLTGNVRNFSGGTVVVPASQPINKTSLDANFKIQSPTAGGFPTLCVDGSGVSHLIVYDGAVVTFAVGQSAKMYYMTGTAGGTLSAPLLLYTYPTRIDPSNCDATIVLDNAGGINVYFPDATANNYSFPLSGGSPAGNILCLNRSSGGVWSPLPQRVLGMVANGIDYPSHVVNGATSLRWVCTEVTSDYTTLQGNLRGWGFDVNNANVVRASVANASQTTAFLARAVSLSASYIAAYQECINGMVADGTFQLLDCLYILGTQDATNAALNLISSSFPLVASGGPTFAAGKGYTGGDASSKFLDSGYNLSTANLQYTQNDCSLFVWPLTSGSPYSGDYIGSWASGQTAALVDFFGATQIGARINAASGAITAATNNDIGFIGASLTGGNMKVFKDGTQVGTGAWSATGLRNDTMKLLGGGTSDGCGAQEFAGGWGKSLTNNQMRALWQRLYVFGATTGAITS